MPRTVLRSTAQAPREPAARELEEDEAWLRLEAYRRLLLVAGLDPRTLSDEQLVVGLREFLRQTSDGTRRLPDPNVLRPRYH